MEDRRMVDLKKSLTKHAYVALRIRSLDGYMYDKVINNYPTIESLERIVAEFLQSRIEIVVNGTEIVLMESVLTLAVEYAKQCVTFPVEDKTNG
jgi:hypothetical protein